MSPPVLLNLSALAATLMSTNDGEGGASTPRTSVLDNFSHPRILVERIKIWALFLSSPFSPVLLHSILLFFIIIIIFARFRKQTAANKQVGEGWWRLRWCWRWWAGLITAVEQR